MAEIIKDDKGAIVGVRYKDNSDYTVEIDTRSPISGKVRIISKSAGGSGSAADLAPSEARKFFHDGLEILGGGDD